MDFEKMIIKLWINNEIKTAELYLFEGVKNNEDFVLVKTETNNKLYSGESDNYFDAMIELRRCLETDNIQLLCNGAGRNVYPSAMQFSMGNTRKAYKLYLGKQAKISEMIDVFEYQEGIEFVSINEQFKFYNEWLESFKDSSR